ncbi:hypothetical protein I309_04932 [Cryptococcus deuterogattii LA55]|nr:hypothetical protein I309_04932 [Cryptococcus deuterogattii LA55]KIR89684.1 hypothetical protein I304_06571 [Cryptococcus deuterogattii CBS 10090]KIR96532.1 hypothetical protein L804_06011 [Cryptococcus deuterogattii 2001/935-1]
MPGKYIVNIAISVSVKGNTEGIDPDRVMNEGDPICLSRMNIAEEDKRCARIIELEDHLGHRELLKFITIDLPYIPNAQMPHG